jgi:hypothetical protein
MNSKDDNNPASELPLVGVDAGSPCAVSCVPKSTKKAISGVT